MSWEDRVQSQLIITTGDGVQYKPLWKNTCATDIEYNISQFDFPKVAGSRIERGTPMARKFNLEIYFQGEEHIEQGDAFQISANDPRPWNISHPIYGFILVQPVSLHFDYTGFGITQITGSLLETLKDQGLQLSVVPIDLLNANKANLDLAVSSSFKFTMDMLLARQLKPNDLSVRDIVLATRQVTKLSAINKSLYNIGVKFVKTTEDAGNYLNAVNVANASIQQGISQAGSLMTNLQAVINFPGQIINTIQLRSTMLRNQFDTIRLNLSPTSLISDKYNYEAVGNGIVSTMIISSVTNIDYKSRADVLAQIDNIKQIRDDYMDDLDSLQTANGGTETSYVPDSDTITALDDLVNFAIANLYDIALSSKQERIVILGEDSNAVILAHRFYGLLVDDSTIDTFIETNKIYLNEILQIRKGRKLIFYV